VLSRQQFEIVLQARIGAKVFTCTFLNLILFLLNQVLARERIAPYRKDVLATGKGTVMFHELAWYV
jgi:hypothetical protein